MEDKTNPIFSSWPHPYILKRKGPFFFNLEDQVVVVLEPFKWPLKLLDYHYSFIPERKGTPSAKCGQRWGHTRGFETVKLGLCSLTFSLSEFHTTRDNFIWGFRSNLFMMGFSNFSLIIKALDQGLAIYWKNGKMIFGYFLPVRHWILKQ